MAKTKISEFSATPGNNTDIDGINIAEGCAPSGINDAIRELMAQLKDFQAGTAGDSFNGPVNGALNGTLGATTPASAAVTTLTTSSTVTHNGGTANGVAYLNGSKVLTSGSALTFDGNKVNTTKYYIAQGALTAFDASSGGLYTYYSSGGNIGAYADNSGTLAPLLSAGSYHVWSTASEQMRLTSTGLGIGTSSPSYKLDVRGNIVGGTGTIQTAITYDTMGSIGTFSNHGLRIITNSAGVAVFDTSGNLGLGVTPSAWGSNQKALQVGSYGSLSQPSATFNIGNNYYFNGTNSTYINSGANATLYQQTGGEHRWQTAPSGTAGNAISFTQAMTLDASARLGIGTTTTTEKLNIGASGASSVFIRFLHDSDNTGYIGYNGSALTFSTATTERARIDSSGNLLVGTTDSGAYNSNVTGFRALSTGQLFEATTQANGALQYLNVYSATGTAYSVYYLYNGTIVGSISTTSTATAYNTSSDYRLKEDIQPMTGALAKVAALKPVTYKWKADGSDGQGFIAHELAEIFPDAVTGEKDAVDAEGKPVYQGIDVSFLVGTLTAAIQEQQALIDSLKARLDAANL
jgi:hypothetical protein